MLPLPLRLPKHALTRMISMFMHASDLPPQALTTSVAFWYGMETFKLRGQLASEVRACCSQHGTACHCCDGQRTVTVVCVSPPPPPPNPTHTHVVVAAGSGLLRRAASAPLHAGAKTPAVPAAAAAARLLHAAAG